MSRLMSVRRIAAAVRPMDSFTGQPPESTVLRVAMEDGGVPVKKAGGYYIFWDNGSRIRTLTVKGSGYEPEYMELDVTKLEQKRQPTVYLWLKPDKSYIYPPGIRTEVYQGSPGEVRTFSLKQSAGVIRLMEPYPSDPLNPCLIRLLAPDGMELEGRILCICGLREEEYTSIWCARNRAMGLYQMSAPLEHEYGPYESQVLLTISLKADRDGRLYLPVAGGME